MKYIYVIYIYIHMIYIYIYDVYIYIYVSIYLVVSRGYRRTICGVDRVVGLGGRDIGLLLSGIQSPMRTIFGP